MNKLICVALALLSLTEHAVAQSISALVNQPPDGVELAFQLTDGTVLVQGFNGNDWWRLTPDINGNYLHGTWSRRANLPSGYAPFDYASAVLADGRVVIAGGEYVGQDFVLTNKVAIYDPQKDTWTMLSSPPGWTTIGDSPSVVLPDGSFLVGQKLTTAVARLDPKTLTWSLLGSSGRSHFNSEEGWTLMPDGLVLTADVKTAPNSQLYKPTTQNWVAAGSTIVDLHSPTTVVGCITYPGGCYYPPGEIGPQVLRPDGTVFVAGSIPAGATTAHTSIYHPTLHGWVPGPDFPNGDDAGDSGAVLLPNGNVLVGGNSGTVYEFDGTHLTATGSGKGYPLMMLPSGIALLTGNAAYAYVPTGTAQASWRPSIASVPTTVTHSHEYTIAGTQFNGLSQAAAFGDELQTATNYPLVRITNTATKHVFYARTHDHSTMGVATGSTIVTTQFDVPSAIETGPSTLVAVANGVASQPVSITVN